MFAGYAQARDVLFFNGRIATQDAKGSFSEALLVRDGTIAAAGNARDLRRRAGADATRIDLGGRTVIPGLIDSHIHAIRAGRTFATEVNWIGAKTITEAMERIASAARMLPSNAWLVVAGGWTPQQFAEGRRPTQAELVAAAQGRPAYVQLFYRAALLTPETLAAWGIGGDDDAPPGLRLEREDVGALNGWLAGDTPAITRLFERLPATGVAGAAEGTKAFFHELNRYGVTGVIDPGGFNLTPQDYDALFALHRDKALTLRVAYSICGPTPGKELEELKALTQFLPMGAGDDMLRFNGVGERITWAMYNNDAPTQAQKDAFVDVARWAAGRGLALTVHWNNERSAHHLFDMFERVNAETPLAGLRWSVAHLHDASPASLAHMKALGVGWLMQNAMYFAAPAFIRERAQMLGVTPPIGSALRLGLPIGGGTDAHRVMSYNPFIALQWMLDGKTVDGVPTRGPNETPTREEALRIWTLGSAWFAFDDDKRGSLEAGKFADLAVLSQDYFSIPVGSIGTTESLLTMVGGKIVHAAGPFAALIGQ
jgi:predicted amidohydrolase YtcJ